MRFSTFDDFNVFALLNNRYLPWIVNIVLLWLIVWQIWHVMAFLKRSPAPQREFLEIPPPVQSKEKLMDIANLHLFGLSAVEQAPETMLNLQLVSILQSSRTPDSQVLIAVNSMTQHYRVGDVLPGGAVIESILADRVLIRNRGNVEALLLPRSYPNLD